MFNLPNTVTMSRIALAGLFASVLYASQGAVGCWVALVIFVIAVATDLLDGQLARSRSEITNLGKWLDPIADKILAYSAFVSFAAMGFMPWPMVGLMLVRECLVTLFRVWQMRQGLSVAAHAEGKVKTFFHFTLAVSTLIYLSLSRMRPEDLGAQEAGLVLIRVLVILTFGITIFSGLAYVFAGLGESVWRRWVRGVVSFGFIGYCPAFPGTAGSLAAIPVALVYADPVWAISIIILFSMIGFFYAKEAVKTFGQKDPRAFVLDEACGTLLALLWLPILPGVVAGSFFLFRFFDIFKPMGIRRLDMMDRPAGIMLDDLLAGLYANLTMRGVLIVLAAMK